MSSAFMASHNSSVKLSAAGQSVPVCVGPVCDRVFCPSVIKISNFFLSLDERLARGSEPDKARHPH